MNPSDFDGGSACEYKGSACGQCWALTGPGGSAHIQVTDCCAGYASNPSCLTSPTVADCDWCAKNDNQHFDLDWDSYSTVCGGQANAGHCTLTSAVLVNCPASAIADVTTDPLSSSGASDSSPVWAIVLIALASLMLLILLVLIVVLAIRIRNKEERV